MSAAPEEEKKDGDGHGEADAKPKGSKLPLIFAIVNTVGLLGLAGFVVLSKGKEEPKDAKGKGAHAVASQAAEEHGDEAAAHGEAADGHGEGEAAAEAHGEAAAGHATLIVPLGGFIINLKDPGGERYLKAKIGMEVAGEGEVKKEAEGKVSKVRYEILMVLSDLRVVDVSGPEKIEGLKKVMLQKAKKALAPAIKVVGIYPEEWVIQ
jgi:flagellar basal body-associated protein FliL